MASASDSSDNHAVTDQFPESEPLLGHPGDATQRQGESIIRNLITGEADRNQTSQLAALVWSNLLSHPIILFTAHPLLASSALLLQVQATLILQPTTTPPQKRLGTRIHYSIQLLSILCFLGAFIVIEINKGDHPRLTSPHGVLGLLTVISVVLQSAVGIIQFFFPVTVLGSADAGKRIYKYHRWSGYVLLLLEVSTVVAATQTEYNLSTLRIPTWGAVIAIILTLSGLGARIKKHKLGL
ncbi:hypothetical protein N7462_009534 [Penicillium macrosclerotiorum]|uniref:uncharacterized protein n=1 Tax=Penicillium macrosclerotiorum TaxID=303699 RepID=UPI0025477131|nr:uncharacterized protein N7462_009534 [Penicillium macrosclerotiorum]KAJ5674095.1 hypothetical protein N7462_009534 [Penicillium macrosclerotiorum]